MSSRFDNASELFQLENDVAFCNNGSYGAPPKCVIEAKLRFDMEAERNPDLWMSRTSIDAWFQNRQAIAPYLGTEPSNFAFVHNTTGGANAVLSSICWKRGDVIIVMANTYPGVRCACDDVTIRHEGVEVRVIPVPYPIDNEEQFVKAYSSAADAIIESGKTPRLAIVDMISSIPAFRLPYEKIVKALRQRSIEVFVDGAHAPGQIDINLDLLGADYFAGNLHKWFFAPRGTAVFWVAPKHQATIRGPIVSIDNCKDLPKRFSDPMAGRFYWQGTVQHTGFACIKEVLKFCDNLGGIHEIMTHNKKLADQALEAILAEVPDSSKFAIPDSCVAPCLRNFFVPAAFENKLDPNEEINLQLFEEERVWVHTGRLNERLFIRMSCQIYNKQKDYQKLANAVKHFSILGCPSG